MNNQDVDKHKIHTESVEKDYELKLETTDGITLVAENTISDNVIVTINEEKNITVNDTAMQVKKN